MLELIPFFLVCFTCQSSPGNAEKVFWRQDRGGGWVAFSKGELQIWGALMSLFGAQLCVCL